MNSIRNYGLAEHVSDSHYNGVAEYFDFKVSL